MTRIQRPAVGTDRVIKAAVLGELLAAVVARSAQGLQLSAPELVNVAVVRVNVVGDLRHCYLAVGEAEPALRFSSELMLRTLPPAFAAVELLQGGALVHQCRP